MNKPAQILLTTLRSLRREVEGGGGRAGICPEVESRIPHLPELERRRVKDLLQDLIRYWPEHSGRAVYPVGVEGQCPEELYASGAPGDFWNPDKPYGAARRRLLNWLIEQLEK